MRLARFHIALIVVLLIAAVLRFWLIFSDGVAFSSDEAIVGLMARHITQGKPIPTFYYGQAYMGSGDALLIAGGFLILGVSLHTMRLVQALLYLFSIFTAYLLALQMTKRPLIGVITALLLAIPTMLGTVYTTITLGGYNEIILLGNLILLLGWQVTIEKSEKIWRWGILGLLMGIGWWTNGAIITPIFVVGIMGLRHFALSRWKLYLIAAAAFVIGGLPWWIYNLQHNWEALNFLLHQELPLGVEPLSLPEKLIAFFIIGLSALYGFRFPWEASFQATPLALLAGIAYLILVSQMIVRFYSRLRTGKTSAINKGFQPLADEYLSETSRWVWLTFGVMFLIFILSPFQDATGRYLMPLWIPATLGITLGIIQLPRWLGATVLAAILIFQLGSVIDAAQDQRIEQQLDADLHVAVRDDEALLDFMQAHGYQYGYTSYWVSYRLMFRSEEQVIFDTSLPYDENGYRPHNNRYLPYVEAVKQADRAVWITLNFPDLDRIIEKRLSTAGITYQITELGRYRVYYDFSRKVAPTDFGLNTRQPLATLE